LRLGVYAFSLLIKYINKVTFKITLLGTGTSFGVPMIACKCPVCLSSDPKDNRLRSSVLIESGGQNIIIDTGPDFRYQMLRSKTMHLDGILITHAHKDHTAGLDDVRAFNWINGTPAMVYGESEVLESLRREFAYAFSDSKYPGLPEINLHSIDETPFFIGNIQITPIRVLHHQLPVLGFRIGDFTYITDSNHVSETEFSKIIGSKVIVINGLRHESHISHFNLNQALALIEQWRPQQAYITHISHQMGLHKDVNAILPSGVELGYDGLSFTLDENGFTVLTS
jgi:phosphoribosyl 1,2-cyclic phosphate phosphodiesterase